MARLFLALWPDVSTRGRLALVRDAWAWPAGSRPVPDERLHLTLHFIGSFPRERIPALQARLATVRSRALTLCGARPEVWGGGVAVLRLQDEPALVALHDELGVALAELDVPLDPRPFAPHVTLARKAIRARPPEGPIRFCWRADGFALVESTIGANPRYVVLAAHGPAA